LQLSAWDVWNEDFTTKLDATEYPISRLLRDETPFSGMLVGMKDRDGNKIIFDNLGEAIRDNHTGQFLAGVVTARDVTKDINKFNQQISKIREEDEERFHQICDSMPQLVWTTTSDGMPDFFNRQWYDFTGMTQEQSLGSGWQNCFHPDDMVETSPRWKKAVQTGQPYVTEYRCRSKNGQWRWFLGRALPLRSKQTGDIERWFGTVPIRDFILSR
jgi:PAS domain S-box-containing protein